MILFSQYLLIFADSKMKAIKENCKDAPEKSRKTITHLLSLAVKREISWKILAPLINEMASSLEKSKEIIKVLLTELENLSPSNHNLVNKNGISVNEVSEDNLVVYKTEESSEFEDVLVDEANESGITPQKILTVPKEINKKNLDKSNLQIDDDSFISNAVKVKPENEDSFIHLSLEYNDPLHISNNDQEKRLSEANVSEKSLEIGEESSTKTDDFPKHESTQSSEKPFQCNFCQKSYSYASKLRQHEKIHDMTKPFQCEYCYKYFKTSKGWKQHVRIHTGDRPFKCKTCEKTFIRSDKLKEHERTHTEENPYQCKVCNKSFSGKGGLTRHEPMHYAEKPFKCNTCKKGFTVSHSLKQHERIHTGEKPFLCKHCQKGFACSSNLQMHEKVHTGEKPHHCKRCSKRFLRKRQLKKHEVKCVA